MSGIIRPEGTALQPGQNIKVSINEYAWKDNKLTITHMRLFNTVARLDTHLV